MDEIGLAGNTTFAYVEDNRISEGEINPEVFGFKLSPKESILGGDAIFNAQITRDIFLGEESGAKRDIVVLNAAFALFVDGNVRDMKEAIQKVEAVLDNGNAREHLNLMVDISQKLA